MAMRYFLPCSLLCFISLTGSSQFISQQVTAAAGSVLKGGGYQLSATAGELAVTRLTSSAYILTQGFQQGFRSYHTHGRIYYDNILQTPLGGARCCLAELWMQAGLVTDSTYARPDGSFYFFGSSGDTMVTSAETSLAWGGVNATDALLVLKHFTGFIQLQNLSLKAADVDASATVNSIDALMIARRYTGLVDTFPSGNWAFSSDTLLPPAGIRYYETASRCYGDVNASYLPGLKNSPAVTILPAGTATVKHGEIVSIPLYATEQLAVGAVSLELGGFGQYFKVLDVSVNCQHGALCWTSGKDRLRIAWYSGRAFKPGAGEPILFVNAAFTAGALPAEGWCFRAGDDSELADPTGNPLVPLRLHQARIHALPEGEPVYIGTAWPNPARHAVSFPLFLPEAAGINVMLTTASGAMIRKYKDVFQAGSHEFTMDIHDCQPGIYMAVFKVWLKDNVFQCTRKIVVVPQ